MRLISFLGTGNYQPVRYCLEGSSECCTTPFVAAALACLLPAEEVVVLATEKAENAHREALVQELQKFGKPQPRWVRICDGRSQDELWANFDRLAELLSQTEAEQVVLDITHGFRSQPFFAGAVVSFVRAVEERAPQIRIVYGVFEARDSENRAPIWDLTAVVDLLDWTQAIKVFLASGQGRDLADRAEAMGQRLARDWAKTKMGQPPRVKKFASALRTFSEALVTVRTGELLLARGEHSSAARWLAQAIVEAKDDLTAHIPPLSRALEKISQMVDPLILAQDHLGGEAGQRAMANLARLYLRLGRYAEAGITLREGWVNLYATPEATCPGERLDPKARQIAEQRLAQAGFIERRLMGLRNDLEHGGFREEPLPADAICDQLQRFADKFEQAKPADTADRGQTAGTVWFVSRHPGAIEWAARQGIRVDRQVTHLDIDQVRAGDTVIGTLPVHLAAEVCARGARFFNLSLDVPPEVRGCELSADDLERFGARIEEYEVQRKP